MFLTIELFYFILMIATFMVLLMVAKLPSGISLMCSAAVGIIACFIGNLIGGVPVEIEQLFRYLIEGTFAYIDTILVIITAMVFMGGMQYSGALEYVSVLLVKAFRKFPSLLLVVFMFIIMFPAMVTGSSLASAVTTGALVAPIMIKWGIPKKRVGAIVAFGSILGMVAPPINVPAMVICDVVDIPYVDFALPLLMLSVPVAIVSVLVLGRKYIKPLSKEEVEFVVNTSVSKELSWTVCLPIIVLLVLIIGEMVMPKFFAVIGMPFMFAFSALLCFFVGRKYPFYKQLPPNSEKHAKQVCIVGIIRQSVHKSFGAMGLLMGVGMFMEAITFNGVRGYFATNASALYYTVSPVVGYISMALTLPVFGGVSAFGSASVLGGPFVMMLNGIGDNVVVTCGLSLLAAIGEFLPPTAMSATLAAGMMGEKKWHKITKAALPCLAFTFVYALVYTILFGQLVQKKFWGDQTMLVLFLIVVGIAVVFAVVWDLLCVDLKKLNKSAYQVLPGDQQEDIIAKEVADRAADIAEDQEVGDDPSEGETFDGVVNKKHKKGGN